MLVVSNTSPVSKLSGWIPNVRDEIRRLRLEAGFFVDATVEKFILSQVDE